MRLNNKTNTGLSLIEVVIAGFCFIVAVIPIMNIFSLSVDNTNIVLARTVTYTSAQEIIEQLQTMPESSFPQEKDYTLPNASGTIFLVNNDQKTTIILSDLPKSYTRKLHVKRSTLTTPGKIEATLTAVSKLKADICLKATWQYFRNYMKTDEKLENLSEAWQALRIIKEDISFADFPAGDPASWRDFIVSDTNSFTVNRRRYNTIKKIKFTYDLKKGILSRNE